MSSPFAFAANAELVFQVPTGTSGTDKFGNPLIETIPVKIVALLKRNSRGFQIRLGDVGVTPMQGVDLTNELLEGYLVEPLELPSGIKPPMEAQAVIKVSENATESGTFQLLPIMQNPFLIAIGIQEINRIKGLFRRNQ